MRSTTKTRVMRRSGWQSAFLACVLVTSAAAQGQGSASSISDNALPVIPEARVQRTLIFFPPSPPPLDVPIPRGTPPPSPQAAPVELADYISEIFYPQLGSQLQLKTLSGRQREALTAYRKDRDALREELRRELVRTRDAEPEARTEALRALARNQAAKLAALEATAERLRNDLIAPDREWTAFREWHLGEKERRGFSVVEIAQVMRAYAFYHKSLLPAQRRLLREIAIDLSLAVDSTDRSSAPAQYIFFSPAPARVRLPDDLPADIAAKIAIYQTKESLLKKELYDTVYEYDGKGVSVLFNNSLKALGEKQAPKLAELESIADEIRAGLPPLSQLGAAPMRSRLPPTLVQRISASITRRVALQKEATAKIETVVVRVREKRIPVRVTYRFENDGVKFLVSPLGRQQRSDNGGQVEAISAELEAIAAIYDRAFVELVNEQSVIRQEVAETIGRQDSPSITAALTEAIQANALDETSSSYADYRTAVFQTGLSPAQRRLLFDAAIEQLGLPLPRGEMQPRQRSTMW